ncbi:PAQR family membrane homeostasis protein TrhA [Candidatus Phytoplasma sacchari]|uniref:Hemolysin III family protein n=1 Tax=Candidatus Phytoplasma sacchari TaxID=2609813 RepID=A0ABY7M132_9MOLU|nr:hemolysin III family protein [Candidatus Phytoplasma sacchari]
MQNNNYITKRKQTIGEEIANAISHGLMIPISILIFLLYYRFLLCTKNLNFDNIFPLFLFNFTMLLLYITSFLYHSLSFTKLKLNLRKLDHICIYLLIWGSFVPFLLLNPKLNKINLFNIFNKGKFIFFIQTFIVCLGILGKFFYFNKGKKIHLLLYLFLGWNGLFLFKDLFDINYKISFFLLFGGFLYSIGIFFYYNSSHYKYYHFIWHIFVILGNLSHILAVYFFMTNIFS